MSERFKTYTREEAVKVLVEHTVVMMAGNGFSFEKNEAHGLAVGAALFQIGGMESGAIITVDMEAER